MSDYLPTSAEAIIHYKKDKDFEQDFEQSEIRWVDSDGKTQKTYLPAYEDESPERLLYVVREYIDFYKDIEINEPQQNGNDNARSVYSFWHKVVKGTARDTWDTVLGDHPILDQNKSWDTFAIHVGYYYKEYFDKDVTYKQREYLKSTKKPQDMTVRQWICRMKTINQYIELLERGKKFTETQLIEECITPNIPNSWRKDFMMGNGHTLQSTNEVASKLKILEDHYKARDNKKKMKRNNHNYESDTSETSSRGENSDSTKFKNKCRKHPQGNHEWKDCYLNPNSKNYKQDLAQKKKKQHESNAMRKKTSSKTTSRKKVVEESDDEISDSDNSCYAIIESNNQNEDSNNNDKKKISTELLFQIGDKTFLALADSGASSSLAVSDITDQGTKIKDSKQSDWVTQGGEFNTKGIYKIQQAFLPQFTKQRHFNINVHKINSNNESQYDIILGRDFMSEIGLDLRYSSGEFHWDEVKIFMTPQGHWNKKTMLDFNEHNITATTKENLILVSKTQGQENRNHLLTQGLLQYFE